MLSSIYNRILPVYERYRGHNSGDTADALDGLGAVAAGLGDFTGAERYYCEAMAINSRVLGPEARARSRTSTTCSRSTARSETTARRSP